MNDRGKIDGARAFNRDVERDRCPHAPGTEIFKSWMAGWAQQKAEFQKRLETEHTNVSYAKAS